MPEKKIPMRLCLGCNEMKPKRELVRIVKNKEGEVNLDTTGRMPGRGAYICRKSDCLAAAIKTKRINRTFSTVLDEDMISRLEKEMQDAE
ncbi:MAG: YlxR family protein [Clostridia bacterium]|nr:YlxR family protein [Clostridia bacterium]MEE1024601.1 YlxR family protein [Acutalibacteraceae bacterium]